MNIKRMMAGFTVAVLMLGTLSTTCFAASAENDDRKTKPAAVTEGAATDTANTEEEQLPYEMNVDEDGNFTFTFGDWEWSTADMKTDGTDAAVSGKIKSYLNLRSGSGTEYEIIGHLLPGEKVQVVSEDGDWYQVVIPEQTGYVYKDYVDIHNYVNELHKAGKYDELTKQVMEMKLSVQIFDVFGEAIQNSNQINLFNMFAASESDLDRQLRVADTKMGGCGFHLAYGRKYIDFDNPNAFKVDCILFAFDSECIAELNQYAEKKFHELNDQYRKYIASKPEKCRKQYSDIVANGDEISKHNFTLPETISAKVEKDGVTYTDHLFANADGIARIKLNGWEQAVLIEEQKRKDYVCWLRNPSRQSWSLRMPYEIDGKCRELYPDFLIVRKDPVLKYIVDILEPHNPDFKDNLGKAKGLANYAANEPRIGRVQLIRIGKDAAKNDRFKRLDLAKGTIRNKVLAAINTDELDHIFDTDGVFED